jgi:hypothetical protein
MRAIHARSAGHILLPWAVAYPQVGGLFVGGRPYLWFSGGRIGIDRFGHFAGLTAEARRTSSYALPQH